MRDLIQAQEIFCEAVRLKSFYQGARSSHMSEEKASRLIDELEAKLGRSLFENRKKGKPTSVGLKLFRQWSPSISQLKLLSSDTEVSADTLALRLSVYHRCRGFFAADHLVCRAVSES